MNNLGIETLSNHILIEPLPMPKIIGSIIVPDTVKAPRRGNEGIIIDVGPDPDDKRLVIGAKVLFNQYGGTKITVSGKDYHLLKVSDLFGILKD